MGSSLKSYKSDIVLTQYRTKTTSLCLKYTIANSQTVCVCSDLQRFTDHLDLVNFMQNCVISGTRCNYGKGLQLEPSDSPSPVNNIYAS